MQQNDPYYDSTNTRSPRVNNYQTQSLPRQSSRHFEAYGPQLNGPYMDEMMQRYESSKYDERMVPVAQAGGYGTYDIQGMPQAWNSSGYAQNNLAALGATTRLKPSARGRGALPAMWLDQQPQAQSQQSLPNGYPSINNNAMPAPQMRSDQFGSDTDEDLIPTAIVIKNIPFAVKKEQLVQVMTDMCLPLPYAFNYHFDNGVFRGLAFANFTTAEETAAVIQAMNHFDLQGRKLRVEYKKMLPQAERDRIEREKRERRGQLEEQHRPMAASQLQNQSSMSSLTSHTQAKSPSPSTGGAAAPNIDMNDPVTLNYYSKLILFQSDLSQGETLAFPSSLPPQHRKIIHGLAHQLKMHHASHNSGDQRQIFVHRAAPGAAGMPAGMQSSGQGFDPNRRGLYRAATTDFSDVRDPSVYAPLGRQSSGFLGFSDAQGTLSVGANLRAAKSFADLRSYTPSPAQSAASFPVGLSGNLTRGPEYGPGSPGSNRSNITPTSTANADALLSNGLNNVTLNTGFGPSGSSPHRLRGMMSWDREVPGPIGGHRSFSATADEVARNRQTGSNRTQRGPLPDRSGGYQRGRQNGHQGRGSDDLSLHNGIDLVVE